ncbi:hypothetical protein BABINDRAFT_162946 [Babjeviella inositovora NRRL Y-12698]|uniref:Uncharacterized protein n=1 Tax=Babjeviella inositovora NRRL Y-12698 TaxID=984486 RepID=A0A1E3QMR7_9ASCO|nr:uncharacterized protein BABINDRAFT_162946 [Babjeviella inositovora NRRL Y-12698]ODQ78297.1 hypothetical protein BABINDRAFT_162946 [Babjeviella inositovora NRRL Y-12698]
MRSFIKSHRRTASSTSEVGEPPFKPPLVFTNQSPLASPVVPHISSFQPPSPIQGSLSVPSSPKRLLRPIRDFLSKKPHEMRDRAPGDSRGEASNEVIGEVRCETFSDNLASLPPQLLLAMPIHPKVRVGSFENLLRLNDGARRLETRPMSEPLQPPVSYSPDASASALSVQTSQGTLELASVAKEAEDDSDSSSSSKFSFENAIGGRNTSVKYYKKPETGTVGEILRQGLFRRQKSVYMSDVVVDDDLDDDVNDFEGEEYDDTEELFNRKLFSSDEEIEGEVYADGYADDGESDDYAELTENGITELKESGYTRPIDAYSDLEDDYAELMWNANEPSVNSSSGLVRLYITDLTSKPGGEDENGSGKFWEADQQIKANPGDNANGANKTIPGTNSDTSRPLPSINYGDPTVFKPLPVISDFTSTAKPLPISKDFRVSRSLSAINSANQTSKASSDIDSQNKALPRARTSIQLSKALPAINTNLYSLAELIPANKHLQESLPVDRTFHSSSMSTTLQRSLPMDNLQSLPTAHPSSPILSSDFFSNFLLSRSNSSGSSPDNHHPLFRLASSLDPSSSSSQALQLQDAIAFTELVAEPVTPTRNGFFKGLSNRLNGQFLAVDDFDVSPGDKSPLINGLTFGSGRIRGRPRENFSLADSSLQESLDELARIQSVEPDVNMTTVSCAFAENLMDLNDLSMSETTVRMTPLEELDALFPVSSGVSEKLSTLLPKMNLVDINTDSTDGFSLLPKTLVDKEFSQELGLFPKMDPITRTSIPSEDAPPSKNHSAISDELKNFLPNPVNTALSERSHRLSQKTPAASDELKAILPNHDISSRLRATLPKNPDIALSKRANATPSTSLALSETLNNLLPRNPALSQSSATSSNPHTLRPSDNPMGSVDRMVRSRSVKVSHLSDHFDSDLTFLKSKYSWYDEGPPDLPPANRNSTGTFDDSLLDEINQLPEDFDFSERLEPERQPALYKSKSFRGRPVKAVSDTNVSLNRIETGSKTVTFFNLGTKGDSSLSLGSKESLFTEIAEEMWGDALTPVSSHPQPWLSPITEADSPVVIRHKHGESIWQGEV